MDFFSAIFGSILAFIGFGYNAEVPTQPLPQEIEQVEEITITNEDNNQIDMQNQQPILKEEENEKPSETENEEVKVVEAPESTETAEVTDTDTLPTEEVAEMTSPSEAPASVTASPEPEETPVNLATMLVAGGCFWCVEADLEKLPGVFEVVSGYAGGTTENPTYDDYSKGGHREVVEVTYDPTWVTYEEILIYAMKHMDPTDDVGSFGDRGEYYSPAFYYENEEQKDIIDKLINEVNENGPYSAPLAIDVEERPKFWPAEDFHQDYYKGTLSQLKYKYYRRASGRDDFIEQHWGGDTGPDLSWREDNNNQTYMWSNYQKPSDEELKAKLDPLAYKVTQQDGTERAGTSPLDKIWEDGIYVDILSGEPLYSSKDKFDSGTGWPSFVRPITPDAVTEHEDRRLFTVRTEIRSAIADNHLGHVFTDGPKDRGGLRYCMNGVALEFVPKAEMEERGYADFLQYI